MRYWLFTAILVLLFSCDKKQPTATGDRSGPVKQVTIAPSSTEADVEEVKLSASFNNMALTNARNIGEFFDHRVKFFKIDAPKLSIGQADVSEIVLYFIDSTLARVRYTVGSDVSNYLMDSLGVSRFKPLDERSKELLASKNVWNKYTKTLHEDLKNYELVWRERNAVTRFRVRKDPEDSINSFLYYQEMPGYRAKIREIETLYHFMDKAAAIPDLN